MGRRSSEVIAKLCEQAHFIITGGENIKSACAQVDVAPQLYRRWKLLNAKTQAKVTRAKRMPKLNVQDLPMPTLVAGKLFMVYGSPEMLSQFARGLS